MKKETGLSIGTVLKYVRESTPTAIDNKTKSQTEMALLLGVSQGYYSNVERGARTVSFSVATHFAAIYGMTLEQLSVVNAPKENINEAEYYRVKDKFITNQKRSKDIIEQSLYSKVQPELIALIISCGYTITVNADEFHLYDKFKNIYPANFDSLLLMQSFINEYIDFYMSRLFEERNK